MSFLSRVSVAAVASVFIVACQSEEAPQKKAVESTSKSTPAKNAVVKALPLRVLKPAASEALLKNSYLRELLPETAYAYVRVPNIWSFLGTPSGNTFDKAVGAKPYVDALNSIKEGFGSTIIPDLPEEMQLLTKIFLQHTTSPIEATVLSGVDSANPLPNLLMTTAVNFKSIETLNMLLEKLAAQSPLVKLEAPVQKDNVGSLSIADLQAQVKLDSASSRVFIVLGSKLEKNNLTEILKALVPNKTHQMTKLENTIDSSGQGLFVWADPRKLIELASALGQQKQLAPLAMLGVSSMKNIGMGMGTSNGIKRLKFVLEMPKVGFRSFIPTIKESPTFNLVGKPKGVAILGMPSKSDFVSIEGSIAAFSPLEKMESYYKGKKAFEKTTGFSIEDMFATLGQDISFVSDEAGFYMAVRLKDAKKFNTMIDTSVQSFGLKHSKREIAGHKYHHLAVPSIDSLVLSSAVENATEKSKDDKNLRLVKRFMGVPSHIYWEQEGDYLIMASIPQVLMDRHYIMPHTPVDQWLKEKQRMDAGGALLLASMRNEGAPEFMYRMNLSMLKYLGDITERPVDLFALPTPREAQLPKDGAYGIKLTSSDSQLAFELAFESNPAEFIMSGGNGTMGGVAVVGILASIALPAYQDYMVRAEVISGVAASRAAQLNIEMFELENGRFPNKKEIAKFDQTTMQSDKYTVSISPKSGKINVELHHKSLRENNQLQMIPEKKKGSLVWKCESGIGKKYLPSSCE